MHEVNELTATLHLAGTLECRDKDGNLLKTIELRGAVPLADLIEQGITDDHIRE